MEVSARDVQWYKGDIYMRDYSTKMLAVVLCSAMAFSSTGCDKDKEGTKEADSSLVTAAGQCADALIARDIEDISDLAGDSFSEEDQARWSRILNFEPGPVYSTSESRSLKAIADTLSFEVNTSSATVNDDGSASVIVAFTMADYSSVLNEDITVISDFEDSIAGAATEDLTIDLTFEKTGDEWLCTNYDVALEYVYEFTNEEYDFRIPLGECGAHGGWNAEDPSSISEDPEITVQNAQWFSCGIWFDEDSSDDIDWSGIYCVVTHNGEELVREEDYLMSYSTSYPGAPADPSGCYLEEGDYTFTFYDADDIEIWSGTATNVIVDVELEFDIAGLDPEYVNPETIQFELIWTSDFDTAQCYFTLEHEGEVVYTEYGNPYIWLFASDCDRSVLDPTGSYLIEGEYTATFYDSSDNVLISQSFIVHEL